MMHESLINYLQGVGFEVQPSDQILDAALMDVNYPLAVVTIDYQTITETAITTHYMVSVYWPNQNNFFLASTTGQYISSKFNVDVTVSPIRNKKPDISGGLLTFDLVDLKHNC